MTLHQSDFPVRYLLIHIHPVSARLRFLRANKRHVTLPMTLPQLSALMDDTVVEPVAQHPAKALSDLRQRLGLSTDEVHLRSDFRYWVETANGAVAVHLAQLLGSEPMAPPPGSDWIELPDSFAVSPIEQQLMLKVYQCLLE